MTQPRDDQGRFSEESPVTPQLPGGMMVSDPVPTVDEPAPLGFAPAGLVTVGEGNDDAASVRPDEGRWENVE